MERKNTEIGLWVRDENTVVRQPKSLDLGRIFDIDLKKETYSSLEIQREVIEEMDQACKLQRDTKTLRKNGVNQDQDTNPLLSDSDTGTHSSLGNWIRSPLSSLVNQMVSAANNQLRRANAINTAIDVIACAALGLVGNFQSPAGGDEVRSLPPTPATLPPKPTQTGPSSPLECVQMISTIKIRITMEITNAAHLQHPYFHRYQIKFRLPLAGPLMCLQQ